MPGSAIISPASFGDTSLPRLDLRPMVSIPGASYDWAADRLNLGPLDQWYDMVQNEPFVAPSGTSQKPVVYESARKVVRFNGVDQRMDANVSIPAASTLVMVGRASTDANSQYMVTGTPSFHIYRGGNGKWATYSGATLANAVTADTNTHVFVVVRNGANSTISVDGTETSGDIGSTLTTSFRLGASSGYFAADIQRFAVLPFAATAAQRSALVAQMKSAYKIP